MIWKAINLPPTGQGHHAEHPKGRCGHNIGRVAAEGVREVSTCSESGNSFGLRWHWNWWWRIFLNTGGECRVNSRFSRRKVAGCKWYSNSPLFRLHCNALLCHFHSRAIIMPTCVALRWMLSVCENWLENYRKIYWTMRIWINYRIWIPIRWQTSRDESWRTVITVCRATQREDQRNYLVKLIF